MTITLNGTTGITTPAITADTDTLYVDATNDRVGVGTTSPTQKFTVSSGYSSLNGLRISGADTSNTIYQSSGDFQLSSDGGNIGIRVNPAGAYFRVLTEGTERMRIDSSGNLLVGTTSASAGNIFTKGILTRGTEKPLGVVCDSNGGSAAIGVGRTNSTGNYVEFYYGGAGTTFTGGISTNGSSTSFNTSSDYRLKENIAPMTGALAKVQALKPVTYTWKATGEADEGFIAHELAEVCPSAVTGEKDAVDAEGNPQYQGIDTSFLVATLTAAIQELKAELDTVKTELATLKGTV